MNVCGIVTFFYFHSFGVKLALISDFHLDTKISVSTSCQTCDFIIIPVLLNINLRRKLYTPHWTIARSGDIHLVSEVMKETKIGVIFWMCCGQARNITHQGLLGCNAE
jgi:hypothetical protein